MGENSQLRYFNDLFILCDEDKINKVTVIKASELFRSASLSNEAIKEVSCGRFGNFWVNLEKIKFWMTIWPQYVVTYRGFAIKTFVVKLSPNLPIDSLPPVERISCILCAL
jgi:hypothetical protein